METFLVGGAVRDKLLGLPVKDRDWVVVGSSPEEMEKQGFKSVGKDFPVFLHPKTKEEHALARTERKSGSGYKGFSFNTDSSVTLEEDLLRRDLTINAIAQDSSGQLIDPYGGQKDIEQKILKHVSPAFSEDPVRVLRIARFAARYKHLGFTVADETQKLISSIGQSGELDHLVPERIWQELLKALSYQNPETFIEVLRQSDVLKNIFPEINALFGIPQTEKYHPEIDTGIHVLMSMQQATLLSDNTKFRFAVLTHDLGKAVTPKFILPSHIGHEKRGKKLVTSFCKRLKIPNDYRHLAELVAENHLLAHKVQELRPNTLLKLLKKMSAFKQADNYRHFVLACEADSRGRTGFEDRPYPQRDFFEQVLEAASKITAADVDKKIPEGKVFGVALDRLRLNAIQQFKKQYNEREQSSNNDN